MKLEEKRTTIFLNPKSECTEPKLKSFLELIDHNEATDTFSQLLKDTVEKVKADDEMRKDYMMFKEFVREVNREENAISNAKAKEEGKAEGISIGVEKGKSEGISIGIEKGKQEAMQALAKQMLLANEPMDKITKYTGLSKEKIEEIM